MEIFLKVYQLHSNNALHAKFSATRTFLTQATSKNIHCAKKVSHVVASMY